MLDFGFYNMDCMEGMKEFPDNYFDLAIVDPPYGININMDMGRRNGEKKKYEKKGWDKKAPNIKYFDELRRVSKNQIIWGANNMINGLNNSSGWIFWDKDITGNVAFSDGELAYTSFAQRLRKVTIRIQTVGDKRIHPTQKPVALYTWLLNNYAKKGDKILDTHVGSASSLIAFHKSGFDYVGFELDKDYYDMATIRLEKEMAQVNMF